jgi:hypothetical protein
MPGPLRVEIARTFAELERLRPAWETLRWGREEAAYPYYVARLRTRPGVSGPFAAVIGGADGPVGGLAGRIESRRLATAIGYRNVYAPAVQAVEVVDGGLVADDPTAREALVGVVADALAGGGIDVVSLPALEVGSALATAFGSLGGPLGHQPLIAPWTHRRLVLPASFDEFLASRSQETRYGTRRSARRLQAELGDRIGVATLRTLGDLEPLVRDLDVVAQTTYQRRLGAGFADTPEQRALARIGLEQGWVRAYVLYLDARPIAYWLCSVYDRTILLRTGGYDPAYEAHAVGIYLLMRLIEDACADPGLDVLDFGPGDARYKRQFSNESRQESNIVLFAPTLRARRINAVRTAILGPARIARLALDAAGVTDQVRTGLRRVRRANGRRT